jgi:hypothetical protein
MILSQAFFVCKSKTAQKGGLFSTAVMPSVEIIAERDCYV